MNQEEFSKLKELIVQDKILLEVSRPYRGAAFSGKAAGCLYTVINFIGLVFIIVFLIRGKFLYSLFVLIGLFLLFKVWSKIAFY